MLPIYYVVTEQYRANGIWLDIRIVLEVFECDIADIDVIYGKYVAPLFNSGRQVQTIIFIRSPGGSFLAVPKSAPREADRIPQGEDEIEPAYPKEVWEI